MNELNSKDRILSSFTRWNSKGTISKTMRKRSGIVDNEMMIGERASEIRKKGERKKRSCWLSLAEIISLMMIANDGSWIIMMRISSIDY